MDTSLFIPKRIKVGYVKRNDTFTKRLAYIIYFDNKGKLRKEASWNSWRDHKIAPEEFDNTPTGGFVLNKNVERCNWSYFSSGRSYIRIYDSRGIEFEITPENLTGVLMHTNCLKRGFEGEFVYAWSGKELVLLPTASEEYKKAVEYTDRQDAKISAKTLLEGGSYTTKQGEEVVYIGRYNWWTWEVWKNKGRTAKKQHIFYSRPSKTVEDGYTYKDPENIFPKNDASFLAQLNSEVPVSDFAEIVEKFKKDIHSAEIVGWEKKTITPILEVEGSEEDSRVKREHYFDLTDDEVKMITIDTVVQYRSGKYKLDGYRIFEDRILNKKTLIFDNVYGNHGWDEPTLSAATAQKRLSKYGDVYAILDNGKKVKLKDFNSITR